MTEEFNLFWKVIDSMVFYTAVNINSIMSWQQLTYSCTSWVLPVLGLGSGVVCPRTLPRKNPEDPVQPKPGTYRVPVIHSTTEPRRTQCFRKVKKIAERGENAGYQHFFLLPQCFQYVSLSGPSKIGMVW